MHLVMKAGDGTQNRRRRENDSVLTLEMFGLHSQRKTVLVNHTLVIH